LRQRWVLARSTRLERRNKWTTVQQHVLWYCSIKEFLIEEGFAVENDLEDDYPGELLFGEGQIERLGNIDETGWLSTQRKPKVDVNQSHILDP
jgi:hypothetical protein